jgi:hypothetical protein
MAPILTNFETNIATLIDGMTTVGGYNYNWPAPNQPDAALTDYPRAQIIVIREENTDSENGSGAMYLTNTVVFEIIVDMRLSTESYTPTRAINAEYNKALDDLKKLLCNNPHVTDTLTGLMYRGMERIIDKSGDIITPGRMITRWEGQYYQRRDLPESFA